MLNKILTGVVLTLGVATVANAAGVSAERGFAQCAGELETTFKGDGLVLDRTYLMKEGTESKTFYINGNVWAATGERQKLRTSCVTDSNGRNVTALTTDSGRYVARKSVATR